MCVFVCVRARALVQGLAVFQGVERNVGAHDDRRISLFDKQHFKIYRALQGVLLLLGQSEWALGVAEHSKARALAHLLGGSDDAAEIDAAAAMEGAYEVVCGTWWTEAQEQARGQAAAAAGRTMCVLEYSLLDEDCLVIWVVSGEGKLLGRETVPIRTAVIRSLVEKARGSMKVRGRDAMAEADASDFRASHRGEVCRICLSKPCTCAADEAREGELLRELYAVLVAPVREHLTGVEEVLIVPDKELWEVPWSALIDADGRYLMERHVLRAAPSLRVAWQAANLRWHAGEKQGHVVLVGNPLPTQPGFRRLPFAEKEVRDVADTLERAQIRVQKQHFFLSNRNPKATKANVKKALEDAGWAHLALHADKDRKSLILAIPTAAYRRDAVGRVVFEDGLARMDAHCGAHKLGGDGGDDDHATSELSMNEIQGCDWEEGVRLRKGATVVLSACNTGRGVITSEGVVGLSRGFLAAGAASAVVTLWSVDDGSTAALMDQMYQYLESTECCTVPQALRLAMLRLARRLPAEAKSNALSLREEWKRPMHWAGFLVVGASTRLPRGAADEPREGREAEDESPETGHIWQGQEGDSGPRNWLDPEKPTDFAQHAGQAEKAALQELGFNLDLKGKKIGEEIGGGLRHGLTPRGFLTRDALIALGVTTLQYSDLFGAVGNVATTAIQLLQSKDASDRRLRVRRAREHLERAVYYRQLDVMAYRFNRQPAVQDQITTLSKVAPWPSDTRDIWKKYWKKEVFEKIKEALHTKDREEILEQYRQDCVDLAITAGTVPVRVQCLECLIGYIKPAPFTSYYSTPGQLAACHQAKEKLHALLQCHTCKQRESAEEDSGRFVFVKTNEWLYYCNKCTPSPSGSLRPRRRKGR